MRNLPKVSVERAFKYKSIRNPFSSKGLSFSECNKTEISVSSGSFKVSFLFSNLAVSFSAAVFPLKTSEQVGLASIPEADDKENNLLLSLSLMEIAAFQKKKILNLRPYALIQFMERISTTSIDIVNPKFEENYPNMH